jgi:hypothetical protein
MGQSRKKVPAEVRRVAVLQVGAFIAAIKEVPVGRRDLPPTGPAEYDARVGDLAPLLPNLFALVLAE